jgi:antitoxin VapB
MPIQIANPAVVEKIEQLASEAGLTKTAAVEMAVDAALKESTRRKEALRRRVYALLAEIDKLPRIENPLDPLQWDENGLPI